ncbi:hypothetical protein ACPPVW_01400 [Leifsonia sp. McL0607]|uniref:hypothetical protein n=1 Tax=Leifsonia sp. McL0607 TaxID=3415672 RepID=UPI003CF241F9
MTTGTEKSATTKRAMTEPMTHETTRSGRSRSRQGHGISVIGVIRSETMKLLTLRSNVITLLAFLPLSLAFVGLTISDKLDVVTSDPTGNLSLMTTALSSAVQFGWLLVLIVGVLAISGEYSTGQIGATLGTVPRRGVVMGGKLVAVGLVVWTVGFVGVLLPALFAVPLFSGAGPLPAVGTVVGAVMAVAVGAATGMTVLALLALCIGGVLRSIAFSVAAAFGLILVLPGLLGLAPVEWVRDLVTYTPSMNARALIEDVPGGTSLGTALGILAGLLVVGVVAWAISLLRRDA